MSASLTYAYEGALPVRAAVERGGRWLPASRVVLVVTLLLAPLPFGAVLPAGWASITLGTCAAFLCWVIASTRRRALGLSFSAAHLAGLGAWLLAAGQLLVHATGDAVGTRESLIKLASYLLLMLLASAMFAESGDQWPERLGWMATFYGFGLSLLSIVQFLSSPGKIYWLISPRFGGQVFGPYVNHNHYAGLMEMLFPLVIVHLLQQRRGQARWFLGFSAMLIFASVALCGSRSGLLVLVSEAGVVVAILLSWTRRRSVAVMAVVLTIALGSGMAMWLLPDGARNHLQGAINPRDAGFRERRALAMDALRIFRANPALGVGLGSFETAYPRYESFPTDYTIDHAHNDYAEFLAETGIAGGLLLLVGLSSFLRCAWQNLRIQAPSPHDWLRLGASIACGGLLLHSFSDFNLHIPANAAWFAFCAGIAMTTHTVPRPVR